MKRRRGREVMGGRDKERIESEESKEGREERRRWVKH